MKTIETVETTVTTVETTATPAAPAVESKAQKVTTNSEIRQHMAASALDFLTIKEESHKAALMANPALDVESASRRAKLGAVGMAADTHARCNGLLAGMGDKELKTLKSMKVDAVILAKDPKAGGFSREHKLQVATIVAAVVQTKRPADLDMGKANEALQNLDPTAPTKRNGHNTINHLIDTLKSKDRFSAGYWAAECNGATQAAYIIALMDKLGLGTVTGSKESRTVTINQDHPVVIALKAIK